MADEPNGTGSGRADPDGTVRSRYDWATVAPATAVVETVLQATGVETSSLEPLHDTLDPDALNTIIRDPGPVRGPPETSVSFVFAGRRVTVYRSGEVVVEPITIGTDRQEHGER